MLLSLETQLVIIFLSVCHLGLVSCKKFKEGEEKPKWAKKDLSFYNDADLERLFDQWEVSFWVPFWQLHLRFRVCNVLK